MRKKNKEIRVFVEVDADAVEGSHRNGWAWIACINDAGKKVRAEGILQRPDISFCLVCSYIAHPNKEDENKKVEIDFAGTIFEIPLSAIRKITLRS